MVHDFINQKQGINQGLIEDKDSALHSGEPWSYQLKVQNTVLADFRPRREAQKGTGLTGCVDVKSIGTSISFLQGILLCTTSRKGVCLEILVYKYIIWADPKPFKINPL